LLIQSFNPGKICGFMPLTVRRTRFSLQLMPSFTRFASSGMHSFFRASLKVLMAFERGGGARRWTDRSVSATSIAGSLARGAGFEVRANAARVVVVVEGGGGARLRGAARSGSAPRRGGATDAREGDGNRCRGRA